MTKLFLYTATFLFLIILLLVSIVMGIAIGSTYIHPSKVLSIIKYQLYNLVSKNRAHSTIEKDTSYVIVAQIREPRTLAAVLGGAALSVAGLIYQVMFRNPIVGPYVLGVSSGASLAVGLVIMIGTYLGSKSVFASQTIVSAALLGAYAVTAVILLVAAVVRSVISLLLIGLMMGYLCNAATSIMMTFAEKERVHAYVMWTLGSFAGYKWGDVVLSAVTLIPMIVIAIATARPLNLLLLGEDYAKTMGLNIKVFRIYAITVASSLTAIVTAFAGPVGFIGVVVPHLARFVMRTNNNTILLPATVLIGGIVTSICDVIARIMFAPIELPINAVTSLFGAPIIIAFLLKRRVRT